MRKYNYVYITTNKINGKFYIGKHSTDNLNDKYLGSGIKLNNAIKKYGKENFKKRILCFCESEEQAFEVEKFLVTEYIVSREDCYNLHIGGDGGKMSDETNKKHSIYMKEYYKTHNTWNKGKKDVYSEDTLKKMSDAHKGKHLSEEHKKHQSESLKGHRSWSKGKHWNHTEEIKEHYRRPKEKCKWLTPSGEIKEMSKNHAKRYHPDWILIDK